MSSLIVEVCRIESIVKHPNADRLSVVGVKGWNCIVGLDQYSVGDLVVFVPPDCIIPIDIIEKYNLEYLRSDGRTKSVKLRGYLSQGLILDLPEGKFKEGDDVSGILGIKKWQPPEPKYSVRGAKQSSKKKLNPLFDKYTDIENIKNYNDVFKDGDLVIVTEKIHGSNSRYSKLPIYIGKGQPLFEKIKSLFRKYILRQNYEFVWGSHNVQIQNEYDGKKSYYGTDVWSQIAKRYDLANIIPEDYIVYGEVYGEGIQDLTYGLSGIDMMVFDIKYQNRYLDWLEVKHLCNEWGLTTVPELYIGQFNNHTLDLTEGKSTICPSQIREGIVIKMLHEENHPKIGRKILKSINPEYLTRKNATEYQ